MRLEKWVEKFGTGALSHLQRESGLAYTTVIRAVKGAGGMRTTTAKKLAKATGGAVSAADIVTSSGK